MYKTDNARFLERHKAMLEKQKEIAPFTPTIRELATLWGISVSAAANTLRILERMGLVISRNPMAGSDIKNYYAVVENGR